MTLREYKINKIIHIVKYADRTMALLEFLIEHQDTAYDVTELAEQFHLSENTIKSGIGKVARRMHYIVRYSQSNNFRKVLVWIEPRNPKGMIDKKGNPKAWFDTPNSHAREIPVLKSHRKYVRAREAKVPNRYK